MLHALDAPEHCEELSFFGALYTMFGLLLRSGRITSEAGGDAETVIPAEKRFARAVIDYTEKHYAENLTPYIVVLWVYIFTANIISLFGISSPTANFSVTLLLALITWILIQIAEFKFMGVGGYFHSFLEPIPVMLPMNIFGKFSTLVSMSLRLFGNILCGGIMMELVYSFCQFLSNSLIGLFVSVEGNVFNFIAPVIAPVLHAYFDIFSGAIQTLVFVTLTVVLIGNDIPEEYKDKA